MPIASIGWASRCGRLYLFETLHGEGYVQDQDHLCTVSPFQSSRVVRNGSSNCLKELEGYIVQSCIIMLHMWFDKA